ERRGGRFFFHSQGSAPTDAPVSSQASGLHLGNEWGRAQLVFPNNAQRGFFRTGTATEWVELWHSGNFDPALKADQSALSAHIGAGGAAHANATTSVDGFMSAADKTKLNGVAAGATANATDAQLRARSSHTGTQAISTIAGLQAALDAKV